MARIRTIKPEFWTSEQVVECSPIARLLFIGMWNFCDDDGNHPASSKSIKMQVFPGDDISTLDIDTMIDELVCNGLVVEYTGNGKKYWHITGWHHQKIEKPSYKYPKLADQSTTAPLPVVDQSTTATPRKGCRRDVEGKVREFPPTPQGAEGEENPHLFTDPDTRRFFPMPMDWQPDPVELQKYVNGKIHAGKPLTLDQVTAHLPDYREATHAKGEKRTESEWCRALVKWAQRCLSNPAPDVNPLPRGSPKYRSSIPDNNDTSWFTEDLLTGDFP